MGNVTNLKVVKPTEKKPARRRRKKKAPKVDMEELERRSAARSEEIRRAQTGGSMGTYVHAALMADPNNNMGSAPIRWWHLRRRIARWIRG